MLQMLFALSLILGCLLVLRWGLSRFAPGGALGRGSGRIRVIESTAVGPKQRLHLVEVEGRRWLLGSSDGGLQRLARLPDAREEQDTAPPAQGADAATARGVRRPRLVNVLGAWLGLAAVLLVVGALLAPSPAMAQDVGASTAGGAGPTISLSIDGATDPDRFSETMQIVLLLTAISVAPSILLMATCFTRILIVLALLRQAIGTPTLPPTQVLVGLALMTTVYVMSPVGEVVYEESLRPYVEREIEAEEALAKGIAPVREYLLAHTRESDLLLFVEMKGAEIPESEEDVELAALLPAFMISEIRVAFEIGFMIYLPFLVIDLVIASMLISLGMIMLPPVMIALPFKLMLFVLVDGWNLTLSALVSGLQ